MKENLNQIFEVYYRILTYALFREIFWLEILSCPPFLDICGYAWNVTARITQFYFLSKNDHENPIASGHHWWIILFCYSLILFLFRVSKCCSSYKAITTSLPKICQKPAKLIQLEVRKTRILFYYMQEDNVLGSLNETNSDHTRRWRLLNPTAKTNELKGLFFWALSVCSFPSYS